MINKNELRLGNYITDIHSEAKIAFSIKQIGARVAHYGNTAIYKAKYCDIEPILLTEEWILKFGFIKNEEFNLYELRTKRNILIISITSASYPEKFDDPYYFTFAGIVYGLRYVHELQNLFFALTKKELTIKDMKTKYTWYPINADNFEDTFDSIEDAIKDAKDKFTKGKKHYDSSETSFHIYIGEVEELDIKSIVESYVVDNIEDQLYSAIDDFSFGVDIEEECSILRKDKDAFREEATNALLPIIEKYVYFNPRMKSKNIKKYDLSTYKWIDYEK